jgi:hypothetical protein
MSLRKNDLKAYLETCEETSRVLASVEEDVLQWAVYREKVLSSFNNRMRKKRKLTENFPENWQGMTISQVAAGQVFVYPWRARKLLRTFRENLRIEQRSLIQHFIEKPWLYGVHLLKEELEMGFFTVTDVATADELLLYSPGVRNIFRTGTRLFLILLFYNGDCYQTFGPIHYYRGFQPYDFDYFAKHLTPQFYRENGLSSTIANDPAAFLLLDGWTETPPIGHRDELVQICSDETSQDSFDPQLYAKDFDIDRKESVVRCKLKGADTPFRSASVYYDERSKKLLVHATGLELYQEVRNILMKDITLPERPYWLATMNMNMAVQSILGKDVPAAAYLKMFEEQREPISPEEQRQLDTFNAVISDVSRHRNEGIPYKVEELARRHNVEIDLVLQAEDIFDRSASKLDLQIEGGVEGYAAPPPIVRQEFRRAPWDNGVFVFLDSPRVRELFTRLQDGLQQRSSTRKSGPFTAPPDSLDAYPRWLEELYFFTHFERDFTLLNITLHILCSVGDGMREVRDYAVEVLRLYWQVFVRTKEQEALELFIQRFALFCFEVLHLGGLVDIDPKITKKDAKQAEFRIEPSAFFRAWASLTRHRSG